jgi:hypothetical protein
MASTVLIVDDEHLRRQRDLARTHFHHSFGGAAIR